MGFWLQTYLVYVTGKWLAPHTTSLCHFKYSSPIEWMLSWYPLSLYQFVKVNVHVV